MPSAPRSEPVEIVARALESEAPYFVDYMTPGTAGARPRQRARWTSTRRSTCSCRARAGRRPRRHLNRIERILREAQEAVAQAALHRGRSAHRRDPGDGRRPLLQPVAVQPRGQRTSGSPDRRSSRSSTWPRSNGRADGRTDITPATIVDDEPTTFSFNDQPWTPSNYDNEYDGPITLRRALAHSRNVATIKVAESTGYDNVAASGKGRHRHAAAAVSLDCPRVCSRRRRSRSPRPTRFFPIGGMLRPLRAVDRIVSGGTDLPIDSARRWNGGPQGHDLPGDQHDAQRSERRAPPRPRARRRSRSTPPARPARPTTCATHGSSASPRSCSPSSGSAWTTTRPRPQRRAGGAADLDPVHVARAGRPRQHAVRGPRRDRVRGHRSRHRQTGHARLPARFTARRFIAGTEPTELCPIHSFGPDSVAARLR